MRKILAAVAVAAAALSVGGVASAKAPPKDMASVLSVKIDKNDPTVAHIKASYRCYSASGEPGHLWVSIKQTGDRTADPGLTEEGSSYLAITSGGVWSDSHRDTAICDGKLHVGVFDVDQVELDFLPFNGTVAKGWGWVQFCLFDDAHPLPPDESDFGNPFSVSVFRYAT